MPAFQRRRSLWLEPSLTNHSAFRLGRISRTISRRRSSTRFGNSPRAMTDAPNAGSPVTAGRPNDGVAPNRLSIVVPVYFNAPNLHDTVPQLLAIADRAEGITTELIFVDDGSGDDSLAILRDFQQQHPARIRVVKLTRNFGSMAAIQAGL